ncbi:MAG: LamG domain-containing protein [Planctomycetes bacterium]|nr:LamG domain-containing protein [Planctomycetota bacterium]
MARNFTRAANEYLMVNSTPVTAPSFGVSAWAKIDADPSLDDYCVWQIQDASVSNQYFRLSADGASNIGQFALIVNDGSSVDYLVGSTIPTIGVWYHIFIAVRAVDDREIFVNGVSENTDSRSQAPSGIDSIAIGREMDSSPADSWSGDLAEIGLWNIDLSNSEIASLALGRSPLGIRPQSLVAYWRLVRDEDLDIVGGYHLTAYNTPGIAPHPPVFYSMPPLIVPPAAVVVVGNPWNYYAQM